MKVLELEPGASAREHGRAHGETFRHLVREIGEIRTHLVTVNGRFESASSVLEAARAHLPVLERFSPSLHAELMGIAEGAGVDPASVVVLNHYTDLKDLNPEGITGGAEGDDPRGREPAQGSAEGGALRREGGASPPPRAEGEGIEEEDCSALFAKTDDGPILAQTWDMHGSAMPYLMMLKVPEREDAPPAWLLSITGCLGMTGLNAAGLGITINNLRSTDARIGVVWPALVRRVLCERDADSGRDVVLGAPLGSGHHYLVASKSAAYGIETSGAHRKVIYSGETDTYVHTNHCADPEIEACTTIGAESTTKERHELLTRLLTAAPLRDRGDVWRHLGSHEGWPGAVCTHLAGPDQPHRMLTCGAIAMDLSRVDAWAAPGCVHNARPHRFDFSGSEAP